MKLLHEAKQKVKKKKTKDKKSTYQQKKASKLLTTWDCFRDYIKTEYQKIINLLGTTLDEVPRFFTKKWVEVNDQSGYAEDRYKPSKQIRFETSILRSDPCDFSDAYIAVKGKVTIVGINDNSEK